MSALPHTDAVLYDSYALPGGVARGSDRLSWRLGALAPRGWSEATALEPWWMVTERLVEAGGAVELTTQVRFIQVELQRVEAAAGGGFLPTTVLETEGRIYTNGEDGVRRDVTIAPMRLVAVTDRSLSERTCRFSLPAERRVEELRGPGGVLVGRVVRERKPLDGLVCITAEPIRGGLLSLRVRIENLTPSLALDAGRETALRSSMLGAHARLRLHGGIFASRDFSDDAPSLGRSRSLAGAPAIVMSSPIAFHDEASDGRGGSEGPAEAMTVPCGL